MVFGMFAKVLMYNLFDFESALLDKFIYVNFLLALFMLLPFPPLDGMMAFFGSRMTYIFLFGIILGYVGLFMLNIFSLVFAVLIGVIIWATYYWIFEK